MQRRFLMAALATATLAVLGGCDVDGSGQAGTDNRSVAPFDAIALHGEMDAVITVGKPRAVTLSGDDNLLPLIETSVVGDRLTIRPTKDIDRELPMKITIATDELTELEVHGVTKARVTGLDGPSFRVAVHGASDATLEGKLDELTIEAHGVSDLDAKKVDAKTIDLQAHGSSSIELGAPESIAASLHGTSSARYDGTPTIDKKLSGSSTLDPR